MSVYCFPFNRIVIYKATWTVGEKLSVRVALCRVIEGHNKSTKKQQLSIRGTHRNETRRRRHKSETDDGKRTHFSWPLGLATA